MEIDTLIENLESILKNAKTVPFTEKVIVDREECLHLIDEIIMSLPEELKQAKWIREERERIIAEAQKDAEDIVKEAENRIISMIDEHEITKKAYDKKNEIIAEANEMYREYNKDAVSYADNILKNIEDNMVNLSKTLSDVEGSLKTALETVQNNRKELK